MLGPAVDLQSSVHLLEKKEGGELWRFWGGSNRGQCPLWDGPIPGPRCEVFISHIPHDAYENVLIPLFSTVGPLWEFRLMMNFSGQNRGFAYAKYGTVAQANEAIRLINGYMLEPGCHLNVCRSTEKKHLFIEDLPASTRPEGLLQALRFMAEGVERVSLKAGPGIVGVSAIVAFSSHHAASMAKKVLVEGFKKSFSLNVSLKWLSVEKSSPAKSRCLQNAPKSLLPSVQPPRLARSQCPPPGFCRAMGGPKAPLHPPPPSSSSQGGLTFAESPSMLLRLLCEGSGLGQPVYKIIYSSTGLYGLLHVTYKVHIPGMRAAFEGMCMIPPGPDPSTTQREAEKAVAQQVLLKVSNKQLTV
ncbi:dead end protein 1 [Nematolebias whitei]|uniref:dead end protein 1 n=1 Tax=Nematolebias whitei TaxID=451745 RepID=UPI001897CAEF|nr:dead end protein 1 [Nematolebias whitei]